VSPRTAVLFRRGIRFQLCLWYKQFYWKTLPTVLHRRPRTHRVHWSSPTGTCTQVLSDRTYRPVPTPSIRSYVIKSICSVRWVPANHDKPLSHGEHTYSSRQDISNPIESFLDRAHTRTESPIVDVIFITALVIARCKVKLDGMPIRYDLPYSILFSLLGPSFQTLRYQRYHNFVYFLRVWSL